MNHTADNYLNNFLDYPEDILMDMGANMNDGKYTSFLIFRKLFEE